MKTATLPMKSSPPALKSREIKIRDISITRIVGKIVNPLPCV